LKTDTSATSPLDSISLESAFDSTFHNKYSFSDFLNLKIEDEYQKFERKEIFIPSLKLKKYLRFLNSFVFDNATTNTAVVHSYQKGKSPYTAVLQHSQNNYFFKTDLKNFFKSIKLIDIKNVIENNLNNTSILDLKTYEENILKLVCVEDQLPVGFPTSPNITNTFLVSFDNQLEIFCKEKSLTYTRYSDDIIISSKEKDALENIHNTVDEYIEKYSSKNFKTNPKKTKYMQKGSKISLLGINLLPTGKITVDSKEKEKIETTFHFFINDKIKYAACLTKFFDGKEASLSATLSYICSIDKTYSDKLRKKYGNFIVDNFHKKKRAE